MDREYLGVAWAVFTAESSDPVQDLMKIFLALICLFAMILYGNEDFRNSMSTFASTVVIYLTRLLTQFVSFIIAAFGVLIPATYGLLYYIASSIASYTKSLDLLNTKKIEALERQIRELSRENTILISDTSRLTTYNTTLEKDLREERHAHDLAKKELAKWRDPHMSLLMSTALQRKTEDEIRKEQEIQDAYPRLNKATQIRAQRLVTTKTAKCMKTAIQTTKIKTAKYVNTAIQTTDNKRAKYVDKAIQTIDIKTAKYVDTAIQTTKTDIPQTTEIRRTSNTTCAIFTNLVIEAIGPRAVTETKLAETADMGVQTLAEEKAETNGAIVAQVERLKSENAELRCQLQAAKPETETTGGTMRAQVVRLASENSELHKQNMFMKSDMQQASAKFDAMETQAERHASENTILRSQLQAANAATAASAEAAQHSTMAYQHEKEQLKKDFERQKEGAEKKYAKVVAELAVAERKAQGATKLEAEVIRLQFQMKQASGVGAMPGAGKKGSKMAQEQLDKLQAQHKELETKFGQLEYAHKKTSEDLVKCDRERARCAAGWKRDHERMRELEREVEVEKKLAAERAAAPRRAVSPVKGKAKRVASEELGGEVKTARIE